MLLLSWMLFGPMPSSLNLQLQNTPTKDQLVNLAHSEYNIIYKSYPERDDF